MKAKKMSSGNRGGTCFFRLSPEFPSSEEAYHRLKRRKVRRNNLKSSANKDLHHFFT